MAGDSLEDSVRGVLAGIRRAASEYALGAGINMYNPLDHALKYVKGRTPPAESYLPVLADAGWIRISSDRRGTSR